MGDGACDWKEVIGLLNVDMTGETARIESIDRTNIDNERINDMSYLYEHYTAIT